LLLPISRPSKPPSAQDHPLGTLFGRTYLLAAAVIGAVIVVVAGYFVSHKFLREFEREEIREKTGDISALVLPVVAAHLAGIDLDQELSPAQQSDLLAMILGDGPRRVLSLQVWNNRGDVVLASDAVRRDLPDGMLQMVLAGGSSSRLIRRSGSAPVLESYVPLRVSNEEGVLGVVAVRSSGAGLAEEMSEVQQFLYLTLAAGMGTAYLAMVGVVWLGQRAINRRDQALFARTRDLARARQETVLAIVSALDLRDTETEGHSLRVQRLAVDIARTLGCREDDVDVIELGALVHDIGKIGVADHILRKPGPLTAGEWQEMRRHPELGYRFLEGLSLFRAAADIVYAHHERYDGGGYPRGLAGEAIPLGARIFAVADAYDAMTSDRPYRRAISHDAAIDEIVRCSGSQFDPAVVDAFLELMERRRGVTALRRAA